MSATDGATQTGASKTGASKTGIGAPVRRVEDQRLLTGHGHFVDDVQLPNVAFAYVVRSPHAHARIARIDKAAALAAPGVLAVLTGEDVVAAKISGLPCASFPKLPAGSPYHRPLQPILAADIVRHVGDRVALIVAETLGQAKDAGELLEVDYEALPAVTLVDALAEGAPKVWPDSRGNVSFQLEYGDRKTIEQKFLAAAHVTKLHVHYPRSSANALEPRAALAYCDPIDGRTTLCTSTQVPFRVRETVANALGFPELNLRVLAQDVGGGFGMKGQVYPEEALVVWAAGKLNRPVRWTGDRSESLASDMHGRNQIADAELALDAQGRILAMRTSIAIDVGAYLAHSAGVPAHNAGISYPGTYHVPLIHAVVRATFTNSTSVGVYRGSAKPEATFVVERLVDKAAREMGIDPVEMRRRNLIRPSAMPYKTPAVYVYDCGDFESVLDKTLRLADWDGFAARRAESEKLGLRRGIGIGMHCQRAGTFSERMEIRVAPNGSLALHVGTMATGQGHETMFAQMACEWLGAHLSDVRVFQGDTDKLLFGRGTFAQRSMSAGGSALKLAAEEVVRKGKRFAGWMLETPESDIEFEHGMFRIKGTDRELSFAQVAEKSYQGSGLPAELGIGLDGVGSHPGPNTFPNGCMICEVEVDPETGRVKVVRLSAVDDVGVIVNPHALEGQLHGSTAQGLGEALVGEVVYDRETGQLLTGSFMDFGMPRADHMPSITSEVSLVPTKTNLLGVKGGAEAGNCGAPPAIIHALIDALSPWGITDMTMPATPERVWRAIHGRTGIA
ncbi:MAG: xanthine dehydrogenase family protein molybdopterin-binding subunit [Betaproteobacteria bacterium]|nr:xanthine dehydrogenase family protein molybdopterin-binding subunit [Betaproteobacteria bacterium]